MQERIQIMISILLVAVLLLIPLSGVKESFQVQNVEKTAMVKSVGLDHENNACISYVQSMIADSTPRHAQGVIAARAISFAEAEKKAQILADKYVSFAYSRHFIFGMRTAQKGIESAMSFLLSSPILQLSSYLYISEGSALEMLESISEDEISTDEVLSNLNLAGKQEGYYYPLTLLEAAKAMAEKRPFAVPIIGQKEEGENTAKKTVPVFKGYAVIQNGKLKTVLGREQSRIYNLLNNRLKRGVFHFQGADVKVLKSKSSYSFTFSGHTVNKVQMKISLFCEFADSGMASLKNDAFVEKIKSEQYRELIAQINAFLAFLKEKQVDLLNLSHEVQIKSLGKIQPDAAGLSYALYSIELLQHFDRSYTLK